MRASIVFPILGAALIALTIPPAAARGATSSGAGHGGMAMHGHSGSGSQHAHGHGHHGQRIVIFNHSFSPFGPFGKFGKFGTFPTFDHFGFAGGPGSTAFGLPFGFVNGFGVNGFGLVDGVTDFGGFVGAAPPEFVVIAPQAAGQPMPLRIAGDLPPCHEVTPVGVVVERGMSCSRAAQ